MVGELFDGNHNQVTKDNEGRKEHHWKAWWEDQTLELEKKHDPGRHEKEANFD